MNSKADICLHIIEDTEESHVLARRYVCHAPRVGDEIRLGGQEQELIYQITRVVWCYDEPDHPFDRANVGVVETREPAQKEN